MKIFSSLAISQIPDFAVNAANETAARLGPFPNNPSHSIEPEFYGMPPRQIPDYVVQGPYMRSHRAGTVLVFLLGIASLAMSRFEWVKNLAYYIVPLTYLGWFGIGTTALAVAGFLFQKMVGYDERYVRDGAPFAVRILACGIFSYRLNYAEIMVGYAIADYRDPVTGAIERIQFKKELGNSAFGKGWELTLTPGDFATAVYRGKKPAKAILYGFTRLNPGVNFILKNGKPWDNVVNVPQIVVPVVLLFGILGLMVRGGFNIWPIDTPPSRATMLSAVIGIAIGGVVAGLLESRWKKVKGLWIIGALLGFTAGMFALPILNSVLDRSEPVYRDIQVVQAWQTTKFHGIIRSYSIEYHETPTGKNRKFPMRLEDMKLFEDTGLGVIEVHRGYFGWAWISGIYPLELDYKKSPDSTSADMPYLQIGKGSEKEYLYPVLSIRLKDGNTMKPSRELIAIMRDQLNKD